MKTKQQWSRWVSVPAGQLLWLTLNEWVAMATLFYVALQIGLLLPKYWRLVRGWWTGRGVQ